MAILLLLAPLSMVLVFGLFKNRSQIHQTQVLSLKEAMLTEPAVRYDACEVRFKGAGVDYESGKAHIYLHANAMIILGYLERGEEFIYQEPFYIRFNENLMLEQKLDSLRQKQLISLQAFGDQLEVNFADSEQAEVIQLSIKGLRLPA